MKEGKPSAVPTQELANLLVNSTEEILDEQLDFCSIETRKLISEFICKDIATFKHQSETSEIKQEQTEQTKRRRERKFDSKLENLYKSACVSLNTLNEKQHLGINLKHDKSDYLN